MNIYRSGISKQINHPEQMRAPVPPKQTDADVIPTRSFATRDQVIKLHTAIHSAIVDGVDDPDNITVDVTEYNEAVIHEVEGTLEHKGWDVGRYYGDDRIVTLVLS